MKKLLLLLLLMCIPVWAQKLSDSDLSNAAKSAAVGEVLSKYDNIEVSKAADGKLQAKVYSSNHYEVSGAPLVQYDSETGEIVAKSRYVKWIPDDVTKAIPVERSVGNTGVKEEYTLVDDKITKLSWTLETNATVVWNESEQKLTFKGANSAYMFDTPKPTAWDSNRKDVKIDATFVKDVLTYVVTFDGSDVFPVIVDPTSVTATGDGSAYGPPDTNSDVARDSDGSSYFTSWYVGTYLSATYYKYYRGFGSFAIPNMSALNSATFMFYGMSNSSIVDFEIYLHTSTYTAPVSADDFIVFDGRRAAMTHNGTILNDVWNSNGFALDWNTIYFNAAGLAAILAKKNSTFKMAAISKRDYIFTTPEDEEYVVFYGSGTSGKEPYLSITFTPPGFAGKVSGVSAPAKVSGVTSPLRISGIQ